MSDNVEDDLWVELIEIIKLGIPVESVGTPPRYVFLSMPGAFDDEVFGGEYGCDFDFGLNGDFFCVNENYLINPRWDLIDEYAWNTLCRYYPKFAAMRLLYV